MSREDTIHYTLQLDVAEGKMAEFAALADQAISHCEANEPGCLVYKWDGDGQTVRIHERFSDEAAMITHATGPAATEIFPKLLEISELVGSIDVHGDLSPAGMEALVPFGATVHGSWKGFER